VQGLRFGAATEPLDGRALTHGVDARAGEGAGSSAGLLSPPDHHGGHLNLSVACGFSRFLVEKWRKEKESEGLPRFWAGRRRSPPPAGPPAAGKTDRRRLLCWCAAGRGVKQMKGSRVSGCSGLLYSSDPGGWTPSRRFGDRRRSRTRGRRGLISAQAGGEAGLISRPSRWLLGVEPTRES
jgi:hypothetical protein